MLFKDSILLVLIPFLLALLWYLNASKLKTSYGFPSKILVSKVKQTWKQKFSYLPFALRLVIVGLFCFALAGPRTIANESTIKTEGIDIVLAIDASGSMAAEDFKKGNRRANRLEVVKDVVSDFISQREDDRIGLVAFAGLAFTVCPLTADYSWLTTNLERIELGLIEGETAIGSAIISSISRLKRSKAKSKVIVLLTDGMNTAGEVDPITAAKAAQTFGIKIYTIGAGSKGAVPFPMTDFFGRKVYQNVVLDIDDEALQEIADLTGGKYYRATDTKSLREVYAEIDKLEKTQEEQKGYREYNELFVLFLLLALGLLFLEILIKEFIFFKVP